MSPAFHYDRGFSEQIFGADKQISAGLVQKMHSGRGNGAFSLHGSDEQIFGVNRQILGQDQSALVRA
jgi:hypothetical protein